MHNYNTRFPLAGNYHITPSRCNHLLKSFSRSGAKIWNGIPQELRKLPKCIFKIIIHNRLLQVLMEEDDYLGTPSLIIRFQNNCLKHRQPKLVTRFIEFLYGKIYFELINAKVSCKCRNKLHLPLRTVVLVFSVQSEGKLCPV